jgi:DNA-binding transcriptional ArsR family regulator
MTQVSVDTVFEVLSNSRRRLVLSMVRRRDEPVPVSTLSTAVGAHEAGISPEEVDASEQKRVYVSLYQSHIPKLEAAGLVEYNDESRTVKGTPAASEIDDYLSPVEPTLQWERLTGGVSVVSLSLFVGTLLDISALQAVSPSLLLVSVVSVLLVVSVAQYFDQRRCRETRPPELQIR